MARTPTVVALLTTGLLLLTGCGSEGRSAADPARSTTTATETSRPVATTARIATSSSSTSSTSTSTTAPEPALGELIAGFEGGLLVVGYGDGSDQPMQRWAAAGTEPATVTLPARTERVVLQRGGPLVATLSTERARTVLRAGTTNSLDVVALDVGGAAWPGAGPELVWSAHNPHTEREELFVSAPPFTAVETVARLDNLGVEQPRVVGAGLWGYAVEGVVPTEDSFGEVIALPTLVVLAPNGWRRATMTGRFLGAGDDGSILLGQVDECGGITSLQLLDGDLRGRDLPGAFDALLGPDGWMATVGEGGLEITGPDSAEPRQISLTGWSRPLAFTADGAHLFIDLDGRLAVVDVATGATETVPKIINPMSASTTG